MSKSKIVTQRDVERALKEPGRHSAGDNLYLIVEVTGAGRWLWYYTKPNGKRGEKGLGSASGSRGVKVTLEQARRSADAFRADIASGNAPGAATAKDTTLFLPYALAYVDKIKSDGKWRGKKTETRWRRNFSHHARDLADLPVATIPADAIRDIIEALRKVNRETARHLRSQCEELFRQAKRDKLRSDNPATRDALALERQPKRIIRHHPALPYRLAPAVFQMAAPEHKLLMLTATRANEVAGALACEFDLSSDNDYGTPVWIIPAGRVKNGAEHVIPLTRQMIALIKPLLDGGSEALFPGARVDTMLKTFKALPGCKAVTQHGLRSTFRDWCGGETNFPRDIVEETYGHGVADPVEAAYRRKAAMKKRRKVLDAWNGHVAPVALALAVAA